MYEARFFITAQVGFSTQRATAVTAGTALACVAQFQAQRCKNIKVKNAQGQVISESELTGLARFTHEPLAAGEVGRTRF